MLMHRRFSAAIHRIMNCVTLRSVVREVASSSVEPSARHYTDRCIFSIDRLSTGRVAVVKCVKSIIGLRNVMYANIKIVSRNGESGDSLPCRQAAEDAGRGWNRPQSKPASNATLGFGRSPIADRRKCPRRITRNLNETGPHPPRHFLTLPIRNVNINRTDDTGTHDYLLPTNVWQ